MSQRQTTNRIDPSQMRNFIEPPADIQANIDEVAEHVARHGPVSEFRLRYRDDGRQRFPFLYLDNEYAPFYQYKVAAARLRIEKENTAGKSGSQQPGTDEGSKLTNSQTSESSDDFMNNFIDLTKVEAFTYGTVADHTQHNHCPSQRTLNANSPSSPTRSTCMTRPSAGIQLPVHTPYSAAAPQILDQKPTDTSPIRCVSPRLLSKSTLNPKGIVPYGMLQEVHLLDNTGTERSGLNTFIIISNSEIDPQVGDPLEYHLYHPPAPVVDHEPTYRLRPDAKAIFRASHSRLLPVGLPLGVEVEILEDASVTSASEVDTKNNKKGLIGVVVRRTVDNGKRLYDVKVMGGAIHRDLGKEQLQVHQGGEFPFRTPNQVQVQQH